MKTSGAAKPEIADKEAMESIEKKQGVVSDRHALPI
jgi:hypothetical protein